MGFKSGKKNSRVGFSGFSIGTCKPRDLIGLDEFAIWVLMQEWRHVSKKVKKIMYEANRFQLSVRVGSEQTHGG